MIVLDINTRPAHDGAMVTRPERLAADLRIFHAVRNGHKTAQSDDSKRRVQAESLSESSREGGDR